MAHEALRRIPGSTLTEAAGLGHLAHEEDAAEVAQHVLRWMAAAERGLAGTGVDVNWYTTRERLRDEVLPWDHIDSGLDKEWLWQDWQDAVDEVEVEEKKAGGCLLGSWANWRLVSGRFRSRQTWEYALQSYQRT